MWNGFGLIAKAKARIFRRIGGLLLIFSGSAWLVSCGVMETRPFSPGYGQQLGEQCATPFGAYFLPKRLIRIYKRANQESSETVLKDGGYVADDATMACLDYLQSYTSDDTVRVTRSADGLLQSVGSNVKDRSADIAIKLINVAESAAIAARSAYIADSKDIIDLSFDPLDPDQLLTAKKALYRFGICVYVENESFDAATMSPQRWCARPGAAPYRSRLAFFSEASKREVTKATGILYRPNISHKVVVMRKSDPEGPGAWVLAETRRIEMPNISPVFSLEIARSFFAQNKTEVTFNNGVLADVRIEKGSELYGFAAIPLALARRVTQIPAEIIKFRIADTEADKQLLEAEVALLNATIEYARTVNAVPPAPAGSDAGRSAALYGNCINADGPADECQRLATGVDR
jgi:hypothetical protein